MSRLISILGAYSSDDDEAVRMYSPLIDRLSFYLAARTLPSQITTLFIYLAVINKSIIHDDQQATGVA